MLTSVPLYPLPLMDSVIPMTPSNTKLSVRSQTHDSVRARKMAPIFLEAPNLWVRCRRRFFFPKKLLHITKFTHTINGCCAPNAGLQLSCPRCMASLSEPNICCTSASKPGGGKRGRLGGSLQSHLTCCSCNPELSNEAQLQPALLLQRWKTTLLLFGRVQ